jgi:hypothetical protein
MPRDPDDLVLDATQIPDDVEPVEFGQFGPWDHRTLGQMRDGQYIMSDATDEYVVTEVDPQTLQVATVKPSCDHASARSSGNPYGAGIQL